jgi:hypothetical protein
MTLLINIIIKMVGISRLRCPKRLIRRRQGLPMPKSLRPDPKPALNHDCRGSSIPTGKIAVAKQWVGPGSKKVLRKLLLHNQHTVTQTGGCKAGIDA